MKQCDIGKSKVFVVLLISGNLPGACSDFLIVITNYIFIGS